MQETTSREKVLKKIRNALISKTENPYPSLDMDSEVFYKSKDSIDIAFAQEFTKASGKFIYCEDQTDLKNNLISLIAENAWGNIFCLENEVADSLDKAGIPYTCDKKDFNNMDVGITRCEFLISRLGSIMISSRQLSGRRLAVSPETHIVIASTKQIVPDLKDALHQINEKYSGNLPSLVTVITGPSRTADIEKTLVMGAHGPKELYLFLIDEQ